MLGKVVDGGADDGAGCLVSMRCGIAFGAVNKVLGFAGNTFAMFKPKLSVSPRPLFPEKVCLFEGHIETGKSHIRILMKA